jgi:holliday junction DNA helicase RuvA
MIATLTGRLKRKAADYLIIEVSGVGYEVHVPLSTYYLMPDEGADVSIYIHTHVREDSLSLFGFSTEVEKAMFLLLVGVSGIGPKLALAVLSSMSVQDLSLAIQSSDDSRLRSIPGIGKKTAARMVLELKDKMKLLGPVAPLDHQFASETGDAADAVSALVNLGYKKPLAEEALKKAKQGRSGLTVEALIKEALGVLMKR